jgi:hypothetical protein
MVKAPAVVAEVLRSASRESRKEMNGSREVLAANTLERNVCPSVFDPVDCWTAWSLFDIESKL